MPNSGRKILMKDIARELNLSITTVSFVINGKSEKKGISAATVKRVNDLIEEWGFNPNNAARILRTGKSKTIGLIVEDISNYFFGHVAKVIELEANRSGYNLFFSSTENNDSTAKELINKMKTTLVDGFIITATKGLKNEILKLRKEGIPFVLIDRLLPGVEANYVVLNNYNGAVKLTEHLLKNGYSKIGFVSISEGMSQMIDRKKGMMDALSKAGIHRDDQKILEIAFGETYEEVIRAIQEFVANNPMLDALFFATNYLGISGIEALQRSNLKVPSDIAVVCFDDNDIFRLLTPSITVAAQPIREIATQAICQLLDLIKEGKDAGDPKGTVIDPVIIVRDSSTSRKKAPVKITKKHLSVK